MADDTGAMAPPDNLAALVNAWEERGPDGLGEAVSYLRLGKKATAFGQPTLAFDILKTGMKQFPENLEIAFNAALALSRAGVIGAADNILCELLEKLPNSEPLYIEVLSLSGKLAKDRWSRLPDGDGRRAAGERSFELYRNAFEISGDIFPGINAATMARLIGQSDKSLDLAKRVLELCGESRATNDFWHVATLGEAKVLLGDAEAAAVSYAKAAEMAKAEPGTIASMRRQLLLLSTCMDIPDAVFAALGQPTVVAVTGHMIDAPDRETPRFPNHTSQAVGEAIGAALDRLNASVGFCSAACGTDILFAEAMQARGAQVNVILPFRKNDFEELSLRHAGDNWQERFDALLENADTVSSGIEEGYLGDDFLFTFANELIRGEAYLRAQQLGVDAVLLAVVDEDSATLTGGAMESVESWRNAGGTVEIIDLASLRRTNGSGLSQVSLPRTAGPGIPKITGSDELEGTWGKRQLATMIFADVVGFSKLTEETAPSFFVNFMGEIASVIASTTPPPAFKNTWGDGLFLAFDDALAAAHFALSLRDKVTTTDWSQMGLPKDTNIRIGMHTGPVFPAFDPVIETRNFFGSHVNRAARIEPVTAPGAVYVSEQTAAVLAATNQQEFACDYLGATQLAKNYNISALYRLRRAKEVE